MERGRSEFRKRVLAEALSEQFGLALVGADADEAEQVAREGLDSSLDEAMVYDSSSGRPSTGSASSGAQARSAHEHLATQIATQVLVLTHELAGLSRDRRGQRAMLAAVEGERHVVALDMAAKLLESAGYDALFLGPDVPTASLPAVVSDHEPTLFLLSASATEAGARLPDAIDAIASSGAEPPA